MSGSIIARLIAKDLYLYRWLIAAAVLVGFTALPIMQLGPGDGVRTGVNVGTILFVTDVIVLGVFIAMFGVFKERQDGSLLFVLSLPVSATQYALAKLAAALIAFLVPWLALTFGTLALILASGTAPDGLIPGFVAMMVLLLAHYCVLLALVFATMSERWAIAGLLLTSIAIPVLFGTVLGQPAIVAQRDALIPIWSPTVITVICVALGVAMLAVALALFALSRRKDFL